MGARPGAVKVSSRPPASPPESAISENCRFRATSFLKQRPPAASETGKVAIGEAYIMAFEAIASRLSQAHRMLQQRNGEVSVKGDNGCRLQS